MARPKKDPYSDLPEEFKDKVEAATDEQILDMLGDVAKAEEYNRRCRDDDEDLAEKEAQKKLAEEQYKDATKANRLKTRYLYDLLRARGKAE
jgi:hypothetical protein